MKLTDGAHLAYCTNVHRGRDWKETLQSLSTHTLAVRECVAPGRNFGIGLRLSDAASRELADPNTLRDFQDWLMSNSCYVFTINGFPFGNFHGSRVKEQVAQPDWTLPARLDYTLRLFDLLTELLPPEMEGSVSTVPVSFKQFNLSQCQRQLARQNLWKCIDHLDAIHARTGKRLHLGLEPEPFGSIENTAEFLNWMNGMSEERPGDRRLWQYLGINYDTCHFALQFEEAGNSLQQLVNAGVKISKLHLSSALRIRPTDERVRAVRAFDDGVYFHQVVERRPDGMLIRYRDLDEALSAQSSGQVDSNGEWRIHFHIPLHSPETPEWGTTSAHLRDTLEMLGKNRSLCQHLEMETYTWEVLPAGWRDLTVEEMLAKEYQWSLAALAENGIFPVSVVGH